MLFKRPMKLTVKYKTVKMRCKTPILCKTILQPLFFVYTDAISEVRIEIEMILLYNDFRKIKYQHISNIPR